MQHGRCHRAIAGGVIGAFFVLVGARPAGAQATPTTDENGRTTDCSPAQLESEFAIKVTGATITRAGEPTRQLDALHAYAFLQTWLPYSIFGNAPQDVPGPQIPRWTVVVDTPGGNLSGNITVFVASDGTDVWVGSPNNTPPPPEKAIKVADAAKTLASMDGLVEATCNAPTQTSLPETSTPEASTPSAGTATTAANSDRGDDGSGALTIVLVALGGALAGAAAVVALRRRS